MDKFDVENVKRSHNIVNVIGQYVRLKKNGKEYTGLCPFHGEKTPSFSVSEQKQVYHCFGCGAHGDVIDFVMNYSGLEFVDAYKQLGGEIDLMPAKEVAKNQKIAAMINSYRLPPDHKESAEKANSILTKCVCNLENGVSVYRYKKGFLLPIITPDFEIINAVHFPNGRPIEYIAGGVSYNGFTHVKPESESDKWVACVSLTDGRYVASKYGVNVAVCWTDAVMKYLCKWNHGGLKITPIIRDCDDDWLCYEMEWVRLDDYKLKKMEVKSV